MLETTKDRFQQKNTRSVPLKIWAILPILTKFLTVHETLSPGFKFSAKTIDWLGLSMLFWKLQMKCLSIKSYWKIRQLALTVPFKNSFLKSLNATFVSEIDFAGTNPRVFSSIRIVSPFELVSMTCTFGTISPILWPENGSDNFAPSFV